MRSTLNSQFQFGRVMFALAGRRLTGNVGLTISMPINIYTYDEDRKPIAWLCDGDWSLAGQIPALEDWLKEKKDSLSAGSYVADVGFKWRRDASCGGPTFSPEAMKTMSDLGIWIFLSEYPGFSDEEEEPNQPPEPMRAKGPHGSS